MNRAVITLTVAAVLVGSVPARAAITLSELLIDDPLVPLIITDDVNLTVDSRIDVTPNYVQDSGTLRSVVVLTHTGTLFGNISNEGEHLDRGIFLDSVTYYASGSVNGELLQAAAGDTNGDFFVDTNDISNILSANAFEKKDEEGKPLGGFDWTQGDFNGDGIVDTDDISAILGANLFEAGIYVTIIDDGGVAQAPEPTSIAVWGLLGIIGMMVHRWRRRVAA